MPTYFPTYLASLPFIFMIPTELNLKFLILLFTGLFPFYDWWAHTYHIRTERMAPDLLFSSECTVRVSTSITEIAKRPLCFIFSYVQLITQHYKWRNTKKGPLQSISHNGKLGCFPSNVGKSSFGATVNWHLALSAKMNGTQRRTVVSSWRMHCMYMQYAKRHQCMGLNSSEGKIKSIVLAVIKLCLSEGISQSVG